MAVTGVGTIDRLMAGDPVAPLGPDNTDIETVGVIQDLLIGQGFKKLPGPLGNARGKFGPMTQQAIRDFQQSQSLPVTGSIDRATLNRLVDTPATRPVACCGYLTLVLDVVFTGMVRVMSITSQFEGAGLFTAMNRNTDSAGLSFGLIQWAQKPRRLNELLRAFQSQEPGLFVRIFGNGDATVAQRLVAHTAKTRGGTDTTGNTIDADFDLVRSPWNARFIEAGLNRELQRVQVDTAVTAFNNSFALLHAFAPQIRSERGIAFMLDVANQHGDAGAKSIFTKIVKPGSSEAELLVAVQKESVARVRAQFGSNSNEERSTHNRREAFRTSTLLSDVELVHAIG